MSEHGAKHAIRLSGGLGNQLFQAAYGLALRDRLGEDVELDLGWYDQSHGRPLGSFERYRLGELGFSALPVRTSLLQRRGSGFGKLLNLANLQLHSRMGFALGPVLHVGYWQSEDHFADAIEEVAGSFSLPAPTSDGGRRTEAMIRRSERPVSVHVRRGDYLNTDSLAVCTPLYYRAALERVGHDADVFFFSDDIDYCKAEFSDLEQVTFVDDTVSDLEDMALMSACSAHVIANSTFSWWAAWFGERQSTSTRQVIAPEPWFNLDLADRTLSRYIDPKGMVPLRWLTINDPGASA